jgi:hypothetical protein
MIFATGSEVLTWQYKTLGKGFKSNALKSGKSQPFQIFDQKRQKCQKIVQIRDSLIFVNVETE